MSQKLQDQHVASLTRIAAGTDILAARVSVDDEVLIVRVDQIGLAIETLHGTPSPGLTVLAGVEYVAMSSVEFQAMPDWQ